MASIEEIREKAVKINLLETNEFLKEFYSKSTYKVKSKYPTIDTIDCQIEKGERCFKYSSGRILMKGPPAKYQNKSYGFEDAFELNNESFKLNAFKGIASANIDLGEKFSVTGTLWELESLNFKKKSIYRAILPLPDYAKKPKELIESEPFSVGSGLRINGYIKLIIEKYSFGLFDYNIHETESLVIECYDEIKIEKFENIVSSILYCFGLISGSLIRNEVTILQYESSKFRKVLGAHFRRIENSLISGLQVIEPKLLSELAKTHPDKFNLPFEIFQSMVSCSLKDLRLYRAIKIIDESLMYPLEIRAATFSVALETLKNIVIEENEKKVNPFNCRSTARKTVKQLKDIVEEIPESKFNNKSSVLSKLEQLNQVGNRDSFLLSFELLDIALNEDDIRCINMRNEFLHGRIPFEDESNVEDYQLQHIVYKLHLLTTSLIMKYCGYSGLVLNNIKLTDLQHFKKNIKEELFRKI